MRIAHLADLHLGFRQFDRMTPTGRNRRDQDVSDVLARAVDGVLAADVSLVLIAGDVFHSARPGNAAMTDAVTAIQRLREKRLPVLIVEGNHDEPRIDVGSPLSVLARVGARVVLKAESIPMPELGCTVLCVADRALRQTTLAPAVGSAGVPLLLAHGSIGGRLAEVADVLPAGMISPDFRYVALGDYHVMQQVTANAWYSGSLDYVSTNPWGELDTPKGWLLVDTETGTVEQQPVPCRRYIDLAAIDASTLTGKELTEAAVGAINASGCADAVVRLVVLDCHKATVPDARAIRKAAGDAFAFRLDIRRPAKAVRVGSMVPVTVEVEEPAEVEVIGGDLDNRSLADRFLAGDVPSFAELMADSDPYGLDTAPRTAAAA